MSWMKRAPAGAPPAAEQPPLGAPQTYGNQQNMYSNYQSTAASNQQPQYWQTQPPPSAQYNQQYGQTYPQQGYTNNANQYYQQPAQYNPNFPNQNFNNSQQGFTQNYYPNQGAPQQNFPLTKGNNDAWEDNWDWGWEDSSKQKPVPDQGPVQATSSQSQVCNNANIIEESFAPTNTWNWAMEDKKQTQEQPSLSVPQESKELAPEPPVHATPEASNQNENHYQNTANNPPDNPFEEIKTLNDKDAVKERLPNLALGKRFHLENLTPQWSIESQMSQESSDGPHTHSEGTYRSENQSRNSSKSSPGVNTENSNFNYSQSRIDEMYPQSTEWSKHFNEDATVVDSQKSSSSRRESHDELSSSMHEMSLSNADQVVSDGTKTDNEFDQTLPENLPLPIQPPPPASPEFVQQVPLNISPASSLPPPPPLSTASQPTSTMLSCSAPPPNFPPPTSSQNPFKHAGPFSHKNISKTHTNIPSQSFPPQMSNTNLTSPAVVSKISQQRMPVGFEANLETTPDNSERPDQPQAANFRPVPVSQQIPDNLEVAPQNDRNEYLQTEHLSSVDYGENTDFSRNILPPGLKRMVVGQQETEYGQNLNISGDEPPPGLARMVPGQQTESDGYNQSSDNYMDRHVDGQLTDNTVRPFRQADGQQTPDYTQPPPARGPDRRPIGLDRMVPGEPSNNEYMQFQGGNYGGANEPRVVTGVDHDYPMHADAGPSDVREQNVDGSDYSEQTVRNPTRSIIGSREATNDPSVDFGAAPEEQQREVTMEGENLQDLSIISGVEMTFSREQMFDVVSGNVTEVGKDRGHDAADSADYAASGSRRHSLNRTNTSGEDSERDRAFKSSPRRDRDKNKPSRDRDRDRERDKDGRYSSRGDRKYDRDPDRRSVRDGRRSEKDRRDRDRDRDKDRERRDRDRDVSPDSRRHRRSTRSRRYETEDTDYYSDRDKERRRYREGSYGSKPPRPDDKERRRYTAERGERYDERYDEAGRRRSDRHRDRDRYERRYRDIDPARKHGNLRRDDDERRRVTFSRDAKTNNCETYSSPSRAGSREAVPTDEDAAESERRPRARRPRPDRDHDAYYHAGYGTSYGDPFLLQRQQYSYYERLRRTDPAAYMRLYKQLLAAPHSLYAEGYGSMGYDMRGEERASVHSGRSSANGLKGNDTYYGCRLDAGSLRDAPSLRTDLSDRDLNTDASLNLHLEESTVRSERMTPFKFSTAHIKGCVSARHLVVVQAAYPVDGRPATVQLVPLAAAAAHHPHRQELLAYPGPLIKGVTHKKSVMEYCGACAAAARGAGLRDPLGHVLLWELLALLLRQNGMVVGTDIAELLMKNVREHEYQPNTAPRPGSRRDSSASREGCESERASIVERSPAPASAPDAVPSPGPVDYTPLEEESSPQPPVVDERTALDRLRELLIYGNRQEALEWAMNNKLWGHALQLAAYSERRVRAGVAARFLASVPRRDPLHTLYSTLSARSPPAATCVADERWGDWRPHAAIMLSNGGARPEHDRRALTQLGDSLASRGLTFSAQFCYLSGGVQFARHPLAPLQSPPTGDTPPTPAAPPRLSLLLAEPRANTLQQFATNQAIFATEIYEYALSLSQEDYVIEELQVYKLVAACRLLDVGECERALAYVERAARAVTRAPRHYPPALPARLAHLADRLRYYDPALQEDPPLVDDAEPDSAEPSPRHHQQWLDDVKNVATMLQSEGWQHSTPQPHQPSHQYQQHQQHQQPAYHDQQTLQYQPPVQTYPEAEETPDYAAQYYQGQFAQSQYPPPEAPLPQPEGTYGTHEHAQQHDDPPPEQQVAPREGEASYSYAEEQASTYADPYWQNDSHYGYGEAVTGAADEGTEPRPTITMPGTAPTRPSPYADYDDDRPSSTDANTGERDADAKGKKQEGKGKEDQGKAEGRGKGGWFGGIFNKLSLRSPNQMILPDDKNPTIVWDAEHKRWRNLESDGDDAPRPPPPPPSGPPAPAPPAPPAQGGAVVGGAVGAPTGVPPVANIFKMQKGRHIKKSYVDVFNPSGAATRPLPPAAEVLGAPPPAAGAATPAYFVPTHAPQGGFYDPTQMGGEEYRSGI
ncbi:uncharacterized protein Sec16 isoform X3 [Battus philenor]|uniref:uncharacterized protein Sec16 isoform X3 n=1 Tax=Battus philenor TaxID=42288 RepID=UPI0035D09A4F